MGYQRRVNSISPEELHLVKQTIIEIDHEEGVGAKVLGFFSLVNVLWGLSFVGILATCVPVVVFCCAGMVEVLIAFFLNRISFMVYEVVAYGMVFLLIVIGSQYNEEMAPMFAFFGSACVPALLGLTTFLTRLSTNIQLHAQTMNSTSYWYCALLFVPLAVMYQSTLVGWLAVIAMYGALGFGVAAYGLCYVVGFDSKEKMARCTMASLLIVSIFVMLRVLGVRSTILVPFLQPI